MSPLDAWTARQLGAAPKLSPEQAARLRALLPPAPAPVPVVRPG